MCAGGKVVEPFLLNTLALIPDPEIPVVNIVEMGIVRDARVQDEEVVVTITPTYSGCPALEMIKSNIVVELQNAGFQKVRIEVVLAPPWTTDWLSEETRTKLRTYGIAPPANSAAETLVTIGGRNLACPYCGSKRVEEKSAFGSTPCKSLEFCLDCKQPFEAFKAI